LMRERWLLLRRSGTRRQDDAIDMGPVFNPEFGERIFRDDGGRYKETLGEVIVEIVCKRIVVVDDEKREVVPGTWVRVD